MWPVLTTKCTWGWCVSPVGQDLKKFSVPSAIWTQATEEAIWIVAPEVGRNLGPCFTGVKTATHWPGTPTATVTRVRIRLTLWGATTRLGFIYWRGQYGFSNTGSREELTFPEHPCLSTLHSVQWALCLLSMTRICWLHNVRKGWGRGWYVRGRLSRLTARKAKILFSALASSASLDWTWKNLNIKSRGIANQSRLILIHLSIIRLHLKQGIQYKLKVGGTPGWQ